MQKTMAKVYNFSEIRGISEIPSRAEYTIVENYVIDSFYVKLRSHSTDLYDFRLVDHSGKMTTLFYGMLQGQNSNVSAEIADEIAGNELNEQLNAFSKTAPTRARKTNKCVVISDATDNVSLIACRCQKGTIIGGWHNSYGDKDVALQMLAYCMYAFAALNSVLGLKDQYLKEKAVDTIPNDSRFAKYSAQTAESTFLSAIYARKDRMRFRVKKRSVLPTS